MNLMHLLPLDLLWLEGNSCFVMLSYSLNLFYLVKCTNAAQEHKCTKKVGTTTKQIFKSIHFHNLNLKEMTVCFVLVEFCI